MILNSKSKFLTWESSRNEEEESSNRSILSLGSSLFLLLCLFIAAAPPPWVTFLHKEYKIVKNSFHNTRMECSPNFYIYSPNRYLKSRIPRCNRVNKLALIQTHSLQAFKFTSTKILLKAASRIVHILNLLEIKQVNLHPEVEKTNLIDTRVKLRNDRFHFLRVSNK